MRQSARTTLILGGARSGKSSYAQTLAEAARRRQAYIATGQALDDEMADRIARHIEERGPSWATIEEPLDISQVIDNTCDENIAVMIDCLTLWLSNLMHAGRDIQRETERLVAALQSAGGPLILVSNEVGMGIVPGNAMSRSFRDAQGRLNKEIAAACDRVEFIAAGLPLRLKG